MMSKVLRALRPLLSAGLLLGLCLAIPHPAAAQLDFGGGPSDDDGSQRKPEDENQKIRERAGNDDEGRMFGNKRPTTPEELYNEAEQLLKRGYYTKAQEYLERVRIRFPFSQYATQADLLIGEVYLKKGDYALAVEAYRDFRKLHPNPPQTHYVVYMMAKAEFEQAPTWAPRDQAATERALEILDGARPPRVREGARFEDRFPDSEYIPEVQELRKQGRERLATQVYHIGRFYQKRSAYSRGEDSLGALRAAEKRYADLREMYPEAEIVVKAELQRIRCLAELGNVDTAKDVLKDLEERAPASREARQARQVVERAVAEGRGAPEEGVAGR